MTPDYTTEVPEKASPLKENRTTLPKNIKELEDASQAVEGAYVETMDYPESVETTGNVSEIASKKKEKKPGKQLSFGIKKTDLAKIRTRLLKNIPSEEKLRHQIEREIRNEIKYLYKKALKMQNSPGELNYFEMSNIMKKIRELKLILSGLLKASLDTLKTLWLRFVHGIM